MDYLDCFALNYGTTLTHTLVPMMRKYTGYDPSYFAPEARSTLGVFSRPKLGSDIQMIELKRYAPFYDDRLGVTLRSGEPKFAGYNVNKKFCYPLHKGMQGFCDAAWSRLCKLGISFLLESRVTFVNEIKTCISCLVNSDQRLETKSLLWTLPNTHLVKLLGYEGPFDQLHSLVGSRIYAFEVDQSAVADVDYIHDFSPNRTTFRYNRAGIYGNQVKLNGRTVIMAEVPTHPKNVEFQMEEHQVCRVWNDMVDVGYVDTEATYYRSTCRSVQVAYRIPNFGWRSNHDEAKQLIANASKRILSIDGGTKGRLSFMEYFEHSLRPVILSTAK